MWTWTFGEFPIPAEFDPDHGTRSPHLSEQDLTRAARVAAEAIVVWVVAGGSVQPDLLRIAAVLDSGYVFAEEGLWALLAVTGLPVQWLPPDPPLVEPPSPRPVVRSEEPNTARWRAIVIDNTSEGWRDAVLKWELEDWGEPTAYLYRERMVHLSCDPPVSLFSTPTPESILGGQGASGAWIDLPDDVEDAVDAAAWVRANIGQGGARPAPTRPRLNIEVAGDDNGSAPYARVPSSALTGEVLTCTDLFDRIAELVDWLDRVRAAVIAPAMAAYADAGVRTVIGAHEQLNGPPYGLVVSTLVWSRKNRLRSGDGGEQGWQRMLTNLQSGKLREIGLRAWVLNGAGDVSRRGGQLVLNVALRDQFIPTHEGPLPFEHPAAITLVVPDALLKRIDHTTTVSDITALIQQAASSFDAIDAYVRWGEPGDRSSSSDEQLWQQSHSS
jgi:hypothetical protein